MNNKFSFGLGKFFADSDDHPGNNSEKRVSSSGRYGDKDGLPTYRYPIYIDNWNGDDETPVMHECIHFTAIKQGGISLKKPADRASAQAAADAQVDNTIIRDKSGIGNGSSGSFVAEGLSGLIPTAQLQEILTASSGISNAQKELRADNGDSKSIIDNLITKTPKIDKFVGGQLKNIQAGAKNQEHCFLYMPASLTSSDGAQWGAEGLGAAGNAIKQTLRKEGNVDDILKNFSGGAVAMLGQAVAIAAGAAAAGPLGAVGAAALLPGIGGGLRAAGRFAQNPYEEQLFNGIGYREFQFEFSLAPSNEAEGIQIDKIIKMFRTNSRPNFVDGALGEGLYTFPNEFGIEFLMHHNGVLSQNTFLPKIHNCVCTNVTTNFAPEGFWVALRDGRPVSYTLSLAFTETKKLTQEDIKVGY